MNITHSVNKAPPTSASLERALLGKLREILGEIGWLPNGERQRAAAGGEPDATIRLAGTDLEIYVRREMRPGTFPAWAAIRQRAEPGRDVVCVLAMPHVTGRLAELCRRVGWSWLDLAGNCWLDVPGRFSVERTGNLPVHRPPRGPANLATPQAARVIRVLLSPAHAKTVWKQRDLRERTVWTAADRAMGETVSGDRPVSLGLVNKVIRHLRAEGFVAESDDGLRLHDPVGLLRTWSEAYRFNRHERLSYFTLLKRPQLDAALYKTDLRAGHWVVYAAFSAAERQAPRVRQPKTWVYVAADFVDTLEEHTQAKEVDSGENFVVLIPEDLGVLLSFDDSFDTAPGIGQGSIGCTDPVQTYVDLLHCGGRGEEAAEAVLEQRLLPAWKRAHLA